MNNMKIYRDGNYSLKDNLEFKAKLALPVLVDRIDGFFTNH